MIRFMWLLASVFGIVAAIQQSWSLPSRKYPSTFGFMILILSVIVGANAFGTYGLEGAWGLCRMPKLNRGRP